MSLHQERKGEINQAASIFLRALGARPAATLSPLPMGWLASAGQEQLHPAAVAAPLPAGPGLGGER